MGGGGGGGGGEALEFVTVTDIEHTTRVNRSTNTCQVGRWCSYTMMSKRERAGKLSSSLPVHGR